MVDGGGPVLQFRGGEWTESLDCRAPVAVSAGPAAAVRRTLLSVTAAAAAVHATPPSDGSLLSHAAGSVLLG